MKKVQKNRSPEEILERRIEKIQRHREVRRSLGELIVLLAAVYVVFTYVIGIAVVNGSSMVPALQDKEILLFYRLDSQFHPGDVVVFRKDGQIEYVKRIVAVAGDEVDLDENGGSLWINGKQAEESYIYTKTLANSDKVSFPLKVEEGQVFVLGDNRENSMDSRDFGCVNVADITGRVLLHAGQIF